MTEPAQYTIRDAYGNTYGPASIELLRQWISEGRIVAGMQIAPEGTLNWIEVSTHPGLADLFGRVASPTPQPAPIASPALPTPLPAPAAAPVDLAYQRFAPRTHVLAIISLVTGILSILSCCCILAVVPGLAAVVTGIFGLREIKARPDDYTGAPLAITGIVLGIIPLIVQLGLLGATFLNAIFNAGR